jgi:hypothetical protein
MSAGPEIRKTGKTCRASPDIEPTTQPPSRSGPTASAGSNSSHRSGRFHHRPVTREEAVRSKTAAKSTRQPAVAMLRTDSHREVRTPRSNQSTPDGRCCEIMNERRSVSEIRYSRQLPTAANRYNSCKAIVPVAAPATSVTFLPLEPVQKTTTVTRRTGRNTTSTNFTSRANAARHPESAKRSLPRATSERMTKVLAGSSPKNLPRSLNPTIRTGAHTNNFGIWWDVPRRWSRQSLMQPQRYVRSQPSITTRTEKRDPPVSHQPTATGTAAGSPVVTCGSKTHGPVPSRAP